MKPNPEYDGKRGHYDGHQNDKFDIEDFGPEPSHMHERADYWKKIAQARLKRGSYFQKLAAGRGQAALDRQAEKEELRTRHMQTNEELNKAYRQINELENLLGSSNAGQIGDAVGMDKNPTGPEDTTWTNEEVKDIVESFNKAIKFLETVNKKVKLESKHHKALIANLTSCENLLDPVEHTSDMGHAELLQTIGFISHTLNFQAKKGGELFQEYKNAMSEFPEEVSEIEGFTEYMACKASSSLQSVLGYMPNPNQIRMEKVETN